jgi:hypothetical protein
LEPILGDIQPAFDVFRSETHARKTPLDYGTLLVSVISKLGPSRLIPTMSMGTAGSVQSLKWRLVVMANIGRASRGVIVTSGFLLAATVLVGILDGWGLHYMPFRGWTYNIWGFACVKLTLGRKIVRVGTDDAEGLAKMIAEKIGVSRPAD